MTDIDHIQLALDDLTEAGLGNETAAEAYVTGWRAGWDKALALRHRHRNTHQPGGPMNNPTKPIIQPETGRR